MAATAGLLVGMGLEWPAWGAPATSWRRPRRTRLAASPAGEEIEGADGGTLRVVLGSRRFPVKWSAEDTVDILRARVAEVTGVPCDSQEVKLAGGRTLGAGSELLERYALDGGLRTLWLTDARPPEERTPPPGDGASDEAQPTGGQKWSGAAIGIGGIVLIAALVEFLLVGLPLILAATAKK